LWKQQAGRGIAFKHLLACGSMALAVVNDCIWASA